MKKGLDPTNHIVDLDFKSSLQPMVLVPDLNLPDLDPRLEKITRILNTDWYIQNNIIGCFQ